MLIPPPQLWKYQYSRAAKKLNRDSGVSLIIAILFVSAFLLVMAGLFEANQRALESIRNRETEAKLQYLAESASEMALYWAVNGGVGANISRDDADADGSDAEAYNSFLAPLVDMANDIGFDCTDIDPSVSVERPCVSFEVHGRAASTEQVSLEGQTYYSVPMKGTGDAVGSAGCGANSAEADDPCNWNKLYLGDSVEIPLFTESVAGDALGGAGGTGGTRAFTTSRASFSMPGSFKLRVRVPRCDVINDVNSGWCGTAGADGIRRLVLYPQETSATNAPYRNINTDPVLIQWQIADLESGVSLVARDANVGGVRPDSDGATPRGTGDNTELTGGRINAANDFGGVLHDSIALEETHEGIDSDSRGRSIANFISAGGLTFPAPTKPVLRLNLVGQPRIGAGGPTDQLSSAELNNHSLDIPYLEYQLLTTSPQVSDSKSELTGIAELGNFKREFKQIRQRSKTLGGFAIESF